eukprot:m.255533 g.255533  ORF g.255533 m.255533 type:complete len:102 (-) comp19162_c1_seq4:366-671(-)
MSTNQFTYEDVAKHSSDSDCWMVVRGNVYDVTKFLDEHPGGEEIMLEVAGKDATEQYNDVGHSTDADEIMKKFLVGSLHPDSKKPEPQPSEAGMLDSCCIA